MIKHGNILVKMLAALKVEAASARRSNALLHNVQGRALGLIHARAAYDIEYARRLVFDHFEFAGNGITRTSSHPKILEAVEVCLQGVQADFTDPFGMGARDWKVVEKLADLCG